MKAEVSNGKIESKDLKNEIEILKSKLQKLKKPDPDSEQKPEPGESKKTASKPKKKPDQKSAIEESEEDEQPDTSRGQETGKKAKP